MAESTNTSKTSQITQKIKIKQGRPPEHHKISLQLFFTKLNPLVKKSIKNPTTLEFLPRSSKNIRGTNHFLNASLFNSQYSKKDNHISFHKIFYSIQFFANNFY